MTAPRYISARWVWALGLALAVVGLTVPVVIMALRPAPRITEPARAVRPEMVIVPAGKFMMGSAPDEPGHEKSETQHEVEITRPFAIGRTEVTQAQWQAVMGSNPSYFQGARGGGPDYPVEQVNWFDALAYLNRLSELERLPPCYELKDCQGTAGSGCPAEQPGCVGDFFCAHVTVVGRECRGYRLPTEAEWEYAARAGTSTALYTGPLTIKSDRTAPELDPIAWYAGNSGNKTHPVGQKQPNPWFLYDLLGNVWEWVDDDYHNPYNGAPSDGQGFVEGSQRLDRDVRGGSWRDSADTVRAARRGVWVPDVRSIGEGFRPARTMP